MITDLCICLYPGVTLKISAQNRPSLEHQHLHSKTQITKHREKETEGQLSLINTTNFLFLKLVMHLVKESQQADSDLCYSR